VKTKTFIPLAGIISSVVLSSAALTQAASTIDAAHRYAYGENAGWLDWRGDTSHGAVIGAYVCSGSLYAANVGWISLGSGIPANQIYYQNLSAGDFGVNQDGLGNLRGYAYGANIGWVNFENIGAPKVDLRTGVLSGYAYSANCGWISLSNSFAFVKTDTIDPGLMDTNGLPIPWELLNFGHTGVDPNADPDGDGMSNLQEYLAGTNPNNANSDLEITAISASPGGTTVVLTWESVLTRNYYVQKCLSLGSPWLDSGLGLISPDGSSTTRTINDANAPMRFYRVQAVRPLTP
jgi:hypothetical protein